MKRRIKNSSWLLFVRLVGRNGSRLCENAAKTITRRHDGLQWLLIGQGDQQGVHGGDMREYGRL
jgi:hypothetical protein